MAGHGPGQHNAGLCADGCRYRSLYEGSQQSLSDMAAKQAQALGRLGLVRSRIVDVLKRYFPAEFTKAERALGHRLSDASDDILLAYLDSFVGGATSVFGGASQPGPAGPGLAELRSQLRQAGVPIPDSDDLNAWADAVSRTPLTTVAHGPHGRATTPAPTAPAPPPQLAPTAAAAPAPAPPATPDPSSTPAPSAGSSGWDDRHDEEPPDLDDLFDDFDPVSATPAAKAQWSPPSSSLDSIFGDDAPLDPPDELDDLFDDHSSGSDTSGAPTGNRGGWAPASDVDDLFDDADAQPPAELGDLFADSGTSDDNQPNQPADFGDLDELFIDTTDADHRQDPGSLADIFADPNPDSATGGAGTGAPAGNLDDLFGDPDPDEGRTGLADLDDLFGDTPTPGAADAAAPAAAVTIPEPAPVASEPTSPAPDGPDAAADGTRTAPTLPPGTATIASLTGPLRPEVAPKKTTRRRGARRGGGKTPRTRATTADPLLDTSGEVSTGIVTDDATTSAILSHVALPRPVFTSDLANVTGSAESVADWETAMRDVGHASPVRFIAGKSRHRLRGSLVIPHGDLRTAATEFDNSWWAECMDHYRGAKLYELAVLLHRVGQEIVSHDFNDDVVKLRLNRPRGPVGVVVVIGTDLDAGGSTFDGLCSALESLIAERHTLVTVLPIHADKAIQDRIAEIITTEAVNRGWRPLAPVTFGPSWEYADEMGAPVQDLLLSG